MTMYDNLSKFTKCSIQYNELKILVDDYDTNKYIRWCRNVYAVRAGIEPAYGCPDTSD